MFFFFLISNFLILLVSIIYHSLRILKTKFLCVMGQKCRSGYFARQFTHWLPSTLPPVPTLREKIAPMEHKNQQNSFNRSSSLEILIQNPIYLNIYKNKT
jgi:hypothetical protein